MAGAVAIRWHRGKHPLPEATPFCLHTGKHLQEGLVVNQTSKEPSLLQMEGSQVLEHHVVGSLVVLGYWSICFVEHAGRGREESKMEKRGGSLHSYNREQLECNFQLLGNGQNKATPCDCFTRKTFLLW